MDHPFLFINHGSLDPDCIDKCEEIFAWFARDVTKAERERIEAGAPSPLRCFWHWDRQFCYFGSEGDTYDSMVMADYAPAQAREAMAKAERSGDPMAWRKAFQLLQKHHGEAVEAFSRDVERWAREVHAIVPLVVFWGPNGGDEEDPWSRDSAARFADAMYERMRSYEPEGKSGKKYLGYIRGMCSGLLVAPKKRGGSAKDEARAIAVLDAAAREHRPKRHVSRLSYPEHDLLTIAGQVGEFLGKKGDVEARLARLAPLTQMVYLASYEAGDRLSPDDVVRLAAPLVGRLAEDERRSAVPLLTMMAETAVKDSPAFDRPRRKHGARAAELLRLGASLSGYNAGTCARAARYTRWGGDARGALSMVEEGLSRFGDRPVLLRAGLRAAKAAGDPAAMEAFAKRLPAPGAPIAGA